MFTRNMKEWMVSGSPKLPQKYAVILTPPSRAGGSRTGSGIVRCALDPKGYHQRVLIPRYGILKKSKRHYVMRVS